MDRTCSQPASVRSSSAPASQRASWKGAASPRSVGQHHRSTAREAAASSACRSTSAALLGLRVLGTTGAPGRGGSGGTGTGPDATAADVPARLHVAARAGVAVLAEQREADAGGLGADALASRGQAVLLADLAPVAGEVVEHGVHRGGRPGQLDDLLLAAPFPDALLGVAGAQLRDLLRVTALVLALLQVVLARAVGGLAGGVSLHLLEEQDQAAQHHRVDQQRLLHVTRSPCARGEDAPADTRTPAGVPVRSTGSTPPPDAPTLAGAPERPAPITPGARRVRKATDRPGEAAPRLPANGGGGPGEADAERGEDDQPAGRADRPRRVRRRL